MNSRNAAAMALSIFSWAFRICAICLCALVVVLCFSGISAQLGIVGLVVDISQALPNVIAGYGLIATPFGGVFRLDFTIVAVVFFVLDYICSYASQRLRWA